MYATTLNSFVIPNPAARLGGEYGYRMNGDSASLSAELAVLDGQALAGADWALQLWACDADASGRLQGVKVAEVEPGCPGRRWLRDHPVGGNTVALPPAGNGAHTMVLALASGANGQFSQIHDFAVFDRPQSFTQPRLDGVVGYRFEGQSVRLTVARIENPRDAGNLSGSLALELWALDAPYGGGAFLGSLVGGVQLGALAGQSEWREIAVDADAAPLPAGRWQLVLMLREWTPAGFVTRDYCNFAVPHVVDIIAAPRRQRRCPRAGRSARRRNPRRRNPPAAPTPPRRPCARKAQDQGDRAAGASQGRSCTCRESRRRCQGSRRDGSRQGQGQRESHQGGSAAVGQHRQRRRTCRDQGSEQDRRQGDRRRPPLREPRRADPCQGMGEKLLAKLRQQLSL